MHVDVVGPLAPSQGFSHLLTVVDRFTRWPEAIPVSNTSALFLARALLQNWVSRFGTPEHITSDRGSQFTSILWSQLSILLGTELHHTASYHPQANGMVEWFHRDKKAALRSRGCSRVWVRGLMSYRGCSSVYAQHQRRISTPPLRKWSMAHLWRFQTISCALRMTMLPLLNYLATSEMKFSNSALPRCCDMSLQFRVYQTTSWKLTMFSFAMMRIVALCTAFTMGPITLSSAQTRRLYST